MRILLVSALPDVARLCGVGHHFPGSGTDTGSDTITRVAAKDAASVAGIGLIDDPLTDHDIAHITGTSEAALAVADLLIAGAIPFLYSPMLPALPTAAERLFGPITGNGSRARADLSIAENLASKATGVIFNEGWTGAWLARRPGFAGTKIFAVPSPRLQVPPGASGSNLAAVFCDAIAPEWNVFRLVQAFEKINAEAVIIAGATDTPYARDCAALAASNRRLRFVQFDRSNPVPAIGETESLLASASVIIDPSTWGLGGGIVAAARPAGMPGVVSRFSAHLRRPRGAEAPPDGLYGFEPSSWELLNHAITMAFNRATGRGAEGGGRADGGGSADGDSNAGIARRLREIYAEVLTVTRAG